MPVSLTEADLDRAENVACTLLGPLNYAGVDDWRRDATRGLKALVGAEVSAFLLPGADAPPLFSEEAPTVTDDDYLRAATSAFESFDIVKRTRAIPTGTMTQILKNDRADWMETPYVQEFLVPIQCFESIVVTLPENGQAHMGEAPHLHLHKSRPQERFSAKDVALMRMLYPAFQAGVEAVRRVGARRAELLRMIDALGEGILLIDARGRVLHESRALAQMAEQDAAMDAVREAMRRAGRGVARNGRLLVGTPVLSEVTTRAARYRLRVSWLTEDLMGAAPAVLVAAQRLTPVLPSVGVLRERFGLTKRQAQVALLLAEGLADKAIAGRLFVSPHTARNHAKRVLRKLGVRSRAQVRPALEA